MQLNQFLSYATSTVLSKMTNGRTSGPDPSAGASPCIPFRTLYDSVFEFARLTEEQRLHLDGGCRSCNDTLRHMRVREELEMDPAWDDADDFSRMKEVLRRLEGL